MVNQGFRLRNISLATGWTLTACGMAAVPGWAQEAAPSATAAPVPPQAAGSSVLEQMQDEVALIASQARAGIVTIEDARAVVYNYTASPLRKSELQAQIASLEAEKLNAQESVKVNQVRYNAGTLTKIELDKNKHDLAKIEARLAALHRAEANSEQDDALTERQQEIDERIAELEIDQKFLAEQEKMIQQQVNAGIAKTDELNQAKQELARAVQNLAAARQQKLLLPRSEFAGQVSNQTLLQLRDAMQSAPKSGSGFSIGDGYILTTADVVQGMSTPIVTTDDGRRARATLVAVDSELNIGLLRLPSALTVPALKLGDSARVVPGHFAISIGNQAGQMNSVSLSLISGTRTQGIASSRHFYPNLLQIDGTMGGGISGAPVLSARGEVIGMWAAALNNEATTTTLNGFISSLVKARQDDALANVLVSPATLTGIAPLVTNDRDGQPTPHGRNNPDKAAPTQPPAKDLSPNVQSDDKEPKVYGQTDERKTNDPASSPRRTRGQSGNFAPALPFSPGQFRVAAGNQSGFGGFFASPANPAAPTGSPSASGFAIPVNAFKGLIAKLKLGKNILHAWLGIDLEDVDNAHETNGFVRLDRQVKVRGVYANSPAAKSGGIQSGDILVSLSDTPVHTANEVRSTVLLRFTSGQKIDVNVRRSGKPVNVQLTLETRPAMTPTLLPTPPNPVKAPSNPSGVPLKER